MPAVSISRRLFFALAAATLVFAAGMAVLTHTFLRHRLTELLEEKGIAVGRQVAEACVNPVITEKYFRIELMLKDLQEKAKDIVYGYVLDADGTAVADTFPGPIPAVPHLHGGGVPPQLDGGPDAWVTSDGAFKEAADHSA